MATITPLRSQVLLAPSSALNPRFHGARLFFPLKPFPSLSIQTPKSIPISASALITKVDTANSNEIKVHVEVPGEKTQTVFNNVFDKMVAAAQPIPGFRRVKGGKTPNIPRDVLLEILGYSNVYRQVIKKLINSTIADYAKQEDLKVGKDLTIEQSYEDLEETFEPGESFSFDAIIKLQEVN